MHSIITGLAVLAVFFVWKHMWRRTLLDTTRDRLFDLRDGARVWFLENGYTLDQPTYRALRRMLNCHLRHTERATLLSFISYSVAKQIFHDYDALLDEKINAEFTTTDPQIAKYVSDVRSNASYILLNHMVKRNLFMTICFYIVFALYFIKDFWEALYSNIKFKKPINKQFRSVMVGAMIAFFSMTSQGQISNVRLEKYSLSQTANLSGAFFVSRCRHSG